MYVPASFAENDLAFIREWLAQHPLGLLITGGGDTLQASPLPLLYRDGEDGAQLVAHMARANPHAAALRSGETCLVVFQGEQNYVTPSWYPSKATTHKVVPTWNYAAVQVRGVMQLRDDTQWLRVQIAQLTEQMERVRSRPWSVQDAPQAFIDAQIKAIVGIEIAITDIKGKWKMSQNRSPEDAQGVIDGLSNPADPHANAAVALSVAQRLATKK